jgi:hypothetical protein
MKVLQLKKFLTFHNLNKGLHVLQSEDELTARDKVFCLKNEDDY